MVTNGGNESSIVRKVERPHRLKHRQADEHEHRGRRIAGGTAAASGAMNRAGRKHSAVTTDARPVRAPTRIPAMLSTNAVPGRCASEARAERGPRVDDQAAPEIERPAIRIGQPCALATPMNVDSESKRSVKRIATMAGSSASCSADDVELQKRPTRSRAG